MIHPLNRRLIPVLPCLFVAGCLTVAQGVAAETESGHDISRYIGGSADAISRDFGEPTLKTPNEWWYHSKQRIQGGMPGAPNPAIVGGRLGAVVTGAGGEYEPLSLSPDACDLTVTVDNAGIVENVDAAGPGCFEYLHELKRQQQADS